MSLNKFEGNLSQNSNMKTGSYANIQYGSVAQQLLTRIAEHFVKFGR